MSDYSNGGGFRDNPRLVALGVGSIIAVLVGAYVFVGNTGNTSAEAEAEVGPTTTFIPRVNVPADARSDEPFIPPPPEEDHEEGHEDGLDPNAIEHPEEADYTDIPIPADQLPVIFPPSDSNLTPADYQRATSAGAAAITAISQGTGREQFPSLFPADAWPDPISPNMVVDYSYAEAVPGTPNLVRTVVVWHGTSPQDVVFRQVRVAQYLQRNADGSFTPVRADKLPITIQRRDGLLSGVSILG